jgi:hypothetical protein
MRAYPLATTSASDQGKTLRSAICLIPRFHEQHADQFLQLIELPGIQS